MDEEKRSAQAKYEKEILEKHKAEGGHRSYVLSYSPLLSSSVVCTDANLRVMTGKGGAGNYSHPSGETSNHSLEEREAHAKVHAHDKYTSTGRG